ncbi:MAG: PilZ domain-containing protein, partial [Candidatus Omnitrophica bacterium]|nr:PilZ domain-containing protein [Candidatus Omnitrophota bacterium]
MHKGERKMSGPEVRERRRVPRFSVSIPLTYYNFNSQKSNQGKLHNLSAQGIGFVTDEELAPGTYLEIWLEMPDNGEQIYTKGKVVWTKQLETNQYRVGINLEGFNLKPIPIVLRIIQVK